MRLALLVDFDETACEQNVAELLLARFCDDGWQDLRRAFREGRITLRQYQETAFRRVRATPEEMAEAVRASARLRPGWAGLVAWARRHRIPLAVVTNGLGFYARALLEPYLRQGVALYAVEAHFEPHGVRYEYPYEEPGRPCWGYGNCKCRVLELYRREGRRVVYIGDSARSDLCPALAADLRFARASLREHLLRERIPHHEFADFHAVVKALREVVRD